MTKHSTLIGGSTADRLLHCPGSFRLIQNLPDQTEVPSEYANYGSAMHAVMDALMAMYNDGFPDIEVMIETARELIGDHFYDRELTKQHIEDSIIPAIESLYQLMNEYGGGFRAVANELKVKFPNVPGAFGTTDLLIASADRIILVDWKFGMGVPVYALYEDKVLGDRVNSQLLYYFAAAINTQPKLFSKKKFAVAIIQPRVQDEARRLTHTTITRKEVSNFIDDVVDAVDAAVGKNPPLAEGDHCRWCPAHPVCPLKVTALFELSAMGPVPARPVPANGDDGTYGEFLAKAKRLVDMLSDYQKQVDDALHTYLANGGTVPGWHLKYKTKLRQWVDEETVVPWLRDHGFDEEEIWQTKLQTFAVVDKVAKRRGVKIPDEFRVAPESTDTTIAPDSDTTGRIASPATVEAEFAAALKSLRHG